MDSRFENDFWDRLALHPELTVPRNADDRVILEIVKLLPDASSPAVRARARARVISRVVPATASGEVWQRTPLVTEPAVAESTGTRLRQRSNWHLVAIAAALLILLTGIGIWAGGRSGTISGLPGHDDEQVIPAVLDGSTNVPMRGINPGRNNVAPGPGLTTEPEVIWTHEIKGTIKTTPLVVDDIIYFGESVSSPGAPGKIVALRASDGAPVWSTPTRYGLSTTFVIAQDTLYAVDDGGVVYAIDLRAGNERWHKTLSQAETFELTWYGAPLVVDNKLIVSSGSRLSVAATRDTIFVAHPAQDWMEGAEHVYALSLSDGSIVWDVEGFPKGSDGGLFALSTSDGSLRWNHQGTPAYLGPNTANGMVYYGESDPTVLIAVDIRTGTERWRTRIADGNLWDGVYSASAVDDKVIVGADDGTIVVVDAASGNLLWQYRVFRPESWMSSGVTIAGDEVLASTVGAMSAVSLSDGSVYWHIQTKQGDGHPPLPVISGDTLYLASFSPTQEIGSLVAYAARLNSS